MPATRLLLCCLVVLTSACAPPRSTRLTADDLTEMAQAMAASLADSAAIRSRTPANEPWTVSIQRVTNLTHDVLAPGELWFVMARLRSSLPMRALGDQRNLYFVIPAEQARAMRDDPSLAAPAGDLPEGFAAQRNVTHVLTAVFHSAPRAVAEARSDYYYCEFEILDLVTGRSVWTDRFELKRIAVGHVWD